MSDGKRSHRYQKGQRKTDGAVSGKMRDFEKPINPRRQGGAMMEIRTLTQPEQKYTYSQSMQLTGQTGCIGYLRGDFGSSGSDFHNTWKDQRGQWNTDGFKAELEKVIHTLRGDNGLLHNRHDMEAIVEGSPDAAFMGECGTVYGFRVDTDQHAFLFRCDPAKGDHNFYCYCYVRRWLDQHMSNAERGISFIDSGYQELFRIPDGGKIMITNALGEKTERSCRYIDEYHVEIGKGWDNLYHICQFAEIMEKNGATYEPKPEEEPIVRKTAKHREPER